VWRGPAFGAGDLCAQCGAGRWEAVRTSSSEKVISMKALSKLFVVATLLAVVLVPIDTMSDELAVPLSKKVLPPGETIQYAGQSLKFDTTVPLRVRLLDMGPGRVRLTFWAIGGGTPGDAPASLELIVKWLNWNNEIYSGSAPLTAWQVDLLTESGFTEK
jgi:hypothetical protein